METPLRIAGYCRISVDEELDRDNVSIENQKSIIADYVRRNFPGASLRFFEDRDRSGYTFEQREGYQRMRRLLLARELDLLIVKDFSRFSRRNSRGLVELEDLRDAGVRILSIGDNVDFPNDDDWLKIQFQFLLNEMPVTDASRKVRSVIRRRQEEGRWVCAAPYGYVVNKRQEFEVVPAEAEVVRRVYQYYLDGWGYKKIANRLTAEGVPTPRAAERARREAAGDPCKRRAGSAWSIVTVQGMLDNDFYTGTLRQGKTTRCKINGADRRTGTDQQIVFAHHHPEIIDGRTFATVRALRQQRTRTNYRGIKRYDNDYSGFLVCGDCGSPLFSVSRSDLKPAYICGAYHRRGRQACTSHHIHVALLDELVKSYLRRVRENAADMLQALNGDLARARGNVEEAERAARSLEASRADLQEELRATKRQRIREIMRHPEREEQIEETYEDLEADLAARLQALDAQIERSRDQRNNLLRVNRAAKTAMDVFDDILEKKKLDRSDLELILERIRVYEGRVEIELKPDVDGLLHSGGLPEESPLVQRARNQREKPFAVHLIRSGDPLEIFTDRDGEVILKKYSPIGELSGFAKEYTESLVKALGHTALICDKDQIVSAAGGARKELQDKNISPELEAALKDRRTLAVNAREGKMLPILAEESTPSPYTAQVVAPILVEGEAVGAVILLSREEGARMGETEIKVAETAAGFIGRQMEQ
ncbi:MAG: stage V sporulation T C-terminal domain-containing protein [Candidatus Spyradocola sp.]